MAEGSRAEQGFLLVILLYLTGDTAEDIDTSSSNYTRNAYHFLFRHTHCWLFRGGFTGDNGKQVMDYGSE